MISILCRWEVERERMRRREWEITAIGSLTLAIDSFDWIDSLD